MRHSMLLTAVIVLAGCVSYSELQLRAPLIEYETSTATSDVQNCITTLMLDRYTVTLIPLPVGQQIIGSASTDGPIVTIDVVPFESGTRVIYRQVNNITALGWKKFHTRVRECGQTRVNDATAQFDATARR
jgi:hypothetical protein